MTNSYNEKLKSHYGTVDLTERILNQLKKNNVDLKNITRRDLELYEEFHIGGRLATRELAEFGELKLNSKVLDIGCGIGGPARTLADEFNCEVVGVDITEEHIRTANNLSSFVGLSEKTKFFVGDATEQLKFDADSFDYILLQHVTMNIENKQGLFKEIARLLKSDGKLLFYEVIKGNDQPLEYPVLWANSEAISFLVNESIFTSYLSDAELMLEKIEDRSQFATKWFKKLLRNPDYRNSKRENVYEALSTDKIRVIRAVYSVAS